MSAKFSPHLWVPSHLLRIIFSTHIVTPIINKDLGTKEVITFVEAAYHSKAKLLKVFKLPNADKLANDLITLSSANVSTNSFLVEICRVLLLDKRLYRRKRIHLQDIDHVFNHLIKNDIDIPLPTEHKDLPCVNDMAKKYVVLAATVVIQQALRK